NTMNLPGIIKLLPRADFNTAVESRSMPGWQLTAMRGTPYGMARKLFVSSLGIPCTKPPWGEMTAIDLTTGAIVWRRPFGTIQDLSPVPIPGFIARALFGDWGSPFIGGPLVTAAGLTFIGATSDYYFRAYDTDSGEELWRYRLDTAAAATPISYLHEGRQHIAIAVGGHWGMDMPRGDAVMVFALPD
ncbi:MAG: PQQ-binding-like beta-propeller repeat protein, partial [Gammaproteobacteria bacterium]|nr:PQQ-binding-like beta-propeller repeat protein [Gammaproteobacteria bacterium]